MSLEWSADVKPIRSAARTPQRKTSRMSKTGWMILVNFVGAVGYILISSSCCWIEPELAGFPGSSGGTPIVWGLLVLPTLILFALINVIWGYFSFFFKKEKVSEIPWGFLVGVPSIWATAIFIDFYHH